MAFPVDSKVFCIGAPKTGTTSLRHAMEKLGFRHKTWDRKLWLRYKDGDLDAVIDVARQFDSFDDGPWNNDVLYQEIDRRFPGSKFVLTERDPASWLRSHEEHFTAISLLWHPSLLWRRSYSEAKRQRILKAYLERNREIKAYFADRPEDLLVMNVVGGDGWETLCPFLGVRTLEQPFPKENVTAQRRRTTIGIWRMIIKRWIRRVASRLKRIARGR